MYFLHVRIQELSNLCPSCLVVGSFAICIIVYWLMRNQKYNLPPGPWSLPLIGYYPIMKEDACAVTKGLFEKYGKIVCFYLGPTRTVVLNDFELIKEAFENPTLQDRPKMFFDFFPGRLGFAVESGEEWIEQRHFAVRTLNHMGLGSTEWQKNLMAEIELFIKLLEEQKAEPFNIEPMATATISNIMISIVLGKRYPFGDPRRKTVDEGVRAITRTFQSGSNVLMVFPKIMKFLCKHGFTRFAADYQKMSAFNALIHSEIQEKKEAKNEEDDEIFVDKYINEMEAVQKKKTRTFFSDNNLAGSAKSIVIGGSDTLKNILMWMILALVDNPEIQKKIQEEIDRVLGRDGRITWLERQKLPYTYAAILEVLRWKVPGPLGVMHKAAKDTKFAGYDIPKDTNVISNISLIHHNEKLWKDPLAFIPERFLNEDGTEAFSHLDNFLPFSVGKRACPGEVIAYIEIFFFVVHILQIFTILPVDGTPVDLSGLCSAVAHSKPQKFRYVLRN